MALRAIAPRRRSAEEWAQVIDAWKTSGQRLDAFAAARGISPRTLAWWRWRLSGTPSAASEPAPLRLVPLALASESTAVDASVGWEIATADGHVLRVHRALAPEELALVLGALTTPRTRRGQR